MDDSDDINYNNVDTADEDTDEDASYDDELEEDKGDEEDIVDDIQSRGGLDDDSKFNDYEEMADAAALQEMEVMIPSSSLIVRQVSKKGRGSGKGRSATKGLRVTGTMHLHFDKLRRPDGKWRLKYGQHIGFCMRKFNINWNWKDVSEGKKKLMWEDTMNLFHIPDEERLRKNFLSSVAKRFRDFKSKLVSGWITKTRKSTKEEDGREPPEIWKHIKLEDWRLFQQLKNSSPAKRKRDKAIKCASKNEHCHHLGQNNYNAAREIWIKDGFYPGSNSTSVKTSMVTVDATLSQTSMETIDANRADDWFCAMHLKDKETGQYVIKEPKTKEVAEKYVELKEKQSKGEFVPERNKDALYYALGEKDDHPSHARGFGGINISVKHAFGESKASRYSAEDREALKNELREEIRKEIVLEVRSNVSSILQEMGVSASRAPDNVNVNKICSQDNAQMNQLELLLPVKIKNDTPCRLLLQDHQNGVSYEVARGKTFPGDKCHQGSIMSDHVRVKVSIVPKEFENLQLPVPVSAYDIYLLRDAIGSFVQWPIALLRLDNEMVKKGPEHELMGSNSHHSRLSTTPTKAPIKEFMVESLSQDCQWLKTLVGTMVEGETYNVYLDAKLFYYNEERKVEVYKNDLQQFLKGCELNTSIIQIFIRVLQEDLMKAGTQTQIGWLCPDTTSDHKLIKTAELAITYVTSAFQSSETNGDEFILAPVINDGHWILLAICPKTYTVYEFDSITLKQGRKLYMKMVILSALRRYKMGGGMIMVKRKEPLWKSVKCPQRSDSSIEYGFFVMRFMHDIVNSCRTTNDLEKVWKSQREDSYTDFEINEVRDKWAMYFTSRCVN